MPVSIRDVAREYEAAVAAHLNYRLNLVALGAKDAVHACNCDLVLCNSGLDADKQMEYVQSLLKKRIDGIMMNSMSMLSREQQAQLAASGVPIVLLNRSASNQTFSTVAPTTNREALWPPGICWVSAIGRSPILPDRASTAT